MTTSPVAGAPASIPLPVFMFSGRSDPMYTMQDLHDAIAPLRATPPIAPAAKPARSVRINNVANLKDDDPLLKSLSRVHSISNLQIFDGSSSGTGSTPRSGSPAVLGGHDSTSSATASLPSALGREWGSREGGGGGGLRSSTASVCSTGSGEHESLHHASSASSAERTDRLVNGVRRVLASAPRGDIGRLELNLGWDDRSGSAAEEAPPSGGSSAAPSPRGVAPHSARWLDHLPALLETVDEKLGELVVSTGCVDRDAAERLSEVLARNSPALRRLDVTSHTLMGEGVVSTLCAGLRYNSALNELSLSGVAAEEVAACARAVFDVLDRRPAGTRGKGGGSTSTAEGGFSLRMNGVDWGPVAGTAGAGGGGSAMGSSRS